MNINRKRLALSGILLLSLPLAYGPAVYAAKPVNLRHQPITELHKLIVTSTQANNSVAMTEINRSVDRKNTLHVRIQETYAGYPVMGADAVVHIPNGPSAVKTLSDVAHAALSNGKMNGIIYQDLDADLAGASPAIFTEAQAQKALRQATEAYQQKADSKSILSEQESKLLVYIDANNKAHWAYKVSFRADTNNSAEKPAKPVYIMDATTFQVYSSWDEIMTLSSNNNVDGGGFGGNMKMGKVVYDGLEQHLAKLQITRDANSGTCFLQNADITVKDYTNRKTMNFACNETNTGHNNVFWDADFDKVNDGYSPGNDAFFGGQVIKHMYNDWYDVPVLTNPDGTPMLLTMIVHQRMYDNAYWDGRQMTFGDGYSIFYPLTSLGVAAHEISHGFTSQHSNLRYANQSGGMNEAYSDMAAQAAEVYAYGPGKNSWQIGPEIFKATDQALRYMDLPSKDCAGKRPGSQCSIDDATQYKAYLDVHYSSGVYNRFFYTLGTTKGWDVRKAFDVMVHANSNYWTSNVTFDEGACGVISAASDLGYDVEAVKAAFDVVKVNYSNC